MCDQADPTHWREAPHIAAGVRQLLRHECDSFDLDYSHQSPGEEHWFKMQARRLNSDGPPHVILAHEDITDLKRMKERAALHAHTLAEANVLLAERNTEL